MNHCPRAAAGFLAAALLLSAWRCGADALPREAVRIAAAGGTLTLSVEVARTPAQRERGLMERNSLGESEGMLFVYPALRSGDAGFWMYHTRIPLDIAFIDPRGRVVAMLTMEPCRDEVPERCPVYLPNARYQWALEVNAGYFARHGVRLGDRVEGL